MAHRQLKSKSSKSDILAFSKFLYDQERKEVDNSSNHEEPYKPDISEGAIQSQVINWLTLQENLGNLTFSRTNMTGLYDASIGGYRSLSKGSKSGHSDLWILKGGKIYFIEFKRSSKKGKQSEDQKEFERLVIKQGGVYLLVRSLGFLEKKLRLVG